MKLRNKKTGKIVEWFNNTGGVLPNSLAELNEEWEDYEEPKRGWFINSVGNVIEDYCLSEDTQEVQRAIGNYFGTREEAEKAVEKLKAWKRLKDKGFRFNGWCDRGVEPVGDMGFGMPKSGEEWSEDEIADLDLLFGGVE